MKVILQKKDEIAGQRGISIDDEYFDVSGWINLMVGDEAVEVFVAELNRALLPFLDQYYRDKEQSHDEK